MFPGNADPAKPATAPVELPIRIVLADWTRRLHHEVELAVLVNQTLRNADAASARQAIAGYVRLI